MGAAPLMPATVIAFEVCVEPGAMPVTSTNVKRSGVASKVVVEVNVATCPPTTSVVVTACPGLFAVRWRTQIVWPVVISPRTVVKPPGLQLIE